MRKTAILICVAMLSLNAFAQVSEQDFREPPQQARPNTFWEWMNGNITKEGITKDLEYMKAAGYGSAMMFNAGVGIARGPVDYNSPQWHEAVIHSVKEAERLGLRLMMHNSPGYTGTGGPWISVENSMKELVWAETYVVSDGRAAVETDLPRPASKSGFYRDAYILAYPSLPDEGRTFGEQVAKVTLDGAPVDRNTLEDNDWTTQIRMEGGQSLLFETDEPIRAYAATVYRGDREPPLDPHDGPRDYAPDLLLEISSDGTVFTPLGTFDCRPLRWMDAPGTLSFDPVEGRYFRITSNRGTNLAEVTVHTSPRIERYGAKINSPGETVPLKDEPQNVAPDQIISSASVVDLTDMTGPDGHLSWQAPEGRWTIVRIGYTTTGQMMFPAPDSGEGLECDKLNKAGVDEHFDKFLDPLLEELRPWCGNTFQGLVIDSWESGKQNWTEGLPEFFRQRRGYDIMPYLLAVTGRIVDGAEISNRFLWDFRRTHSDMFNENYVERFRERAARYGLIYAGEAYGDGDFESLEMAARQDWPMSEQCAHYYAGPIGRTNMAASVGHIWGRQVIPNECYTGMPSTTKFTEDPYGMKALGDYILSEGNNLLVYHTTVHQPYFGDQSGNIMVMGPFGIHVDRASMKVTPFAALNLYYGRSCYMLQQGLFSADLLYLQDEAIRSEGVDEYAKVYPTVPSGYRWDVADAESLLARTDSRDGRIVLPDGMSYRLLVVTPMERTSPEVLRKILSLAEKGASVVLTGEMPVGYAGLDAEKDAEVRELSARLWSAETVGKGRIYRSGNIAGVLADMGLAPDFSFVARRKDARIHFIHRTVGPDEIYFVANHRRRADTLTVTCRVDGKVPQLWDAETGRTGIPAEYTMEDGLTKINLTLPECGSVFIVFRDSSTFSATKPSDLASVIPSATKVLSRTGDTDFDPEHEFNSTFTISLWAKPETNAPEDLGCVLYPAAGEGNRAFVGFSLGQNGVKIYENNAGSWNTALDCPEPIEGWTHIAVTYTEGVPRLYLGGRLAAEGTQSGYDCIPAIDIPMGPEQDFYSFEGDLTEPSVYDYALTPEEIKTVAEAGLPEPRHEGEQWKALGGDWTVRFPPESKAPAEITLPELESLHRNADFNVSHFSGTAVYTKHVTVTDEDLELLHGGRIILDLGRVENNAEVSVNGGEPVEVWKAPYTLDVTDLLKAGDNIFEISVTNLLPNRIIGDESLPDPYEYDEFGRIRSIPDWFLTDKTVERERVLFLPWKFYKKDSPLLEAGLLGPVTLRLLSE